VTFTPDFSAATVRRDLVLFTDQGTYTFPLVAHMPPADVQLCADVQAPHSAQVAHTARTLFIAFCFCMFVFFVIIIVQEYRYQPIASRLTEKTTLSEDIEQVAKPTTAASLSPQPLVPTTPAPSTPKSPTKNARDRREPAPEPTLALPSMTLEASQVTSASTLLTTTSASPKKSIATNVASTQGPSSSSSTNKNRGRSNSKGQRAKIDLQSPFTITTAVPVTHTISEPKSKPVKTRVNTALEATSSEITPAPPHVTHVEPLSSTAPVTPVVISTTLTPVNINPVTNTTIPEVTASHTTLTSVAPLTTPVPPAVTPVTAPLTADKPTPPAVRPSTEDKPPRNKNTKPPNNLPPYHRGPKRSPKSWVRKDEKHNVEAKPAVEPIPVVSTAKSDDASTGDSDRSSTTIAKKEFVKNLYKPVTRVSPPKSPSLAHSPGTSTVTESSKQPRKTPLPVTPVLTPPVSLTPYTPSLESAASEFSYLENYYPEIDGTELVYNNIAALTGTNAHNTATFNTHLTHAPTSPHNRTPARDPFGFGLDQRVTLTQTRGHSVQSPNGTIGSVKPRAFDPWDRPILFDLDGDSNAHVTSNSPPMHFNSPHSPQSDRDTWSEAQHTSPSLFTALPPLFAAPSQHSFFSSPTFPRVSKSSDDVITPPRADSTPLSTSASSLTAYNPFNGGSLFAMSESPFTPFAPHPHTSSFGSFNLQNLSQLHPSDSDASEK